MNVTPSQQSLHRDRNVSAIKLLQIYSYLSVFMPGSDIRMANLSREGQYFYASQYLWYVAGAQ